MSHAISTGTGTGSCASWKKRLTPKQLERKRQSDRMSQRRTRQQTKHTMAELEERLRLLASGDREMLINRLLTENEMLRRKLNHYQSKMELMFLCTKECLDESDTEVNSATGGNESTPTPVAQQTDQGLSTAETCNALALDAHASNKTQRDPPIAPVTSIQRPSIIFESAALVRGNQTQDRAQLEVNELLESMITWKLAHSSRAKFGFLIEHFELDKAPISLTVERVEHFIVMSNLHERVLVSITQGTEVPELSMRPDDQCRADCPTVVEFERRAALVCACALVWHWRSHFRSIVEFVSMFWTQYQYFMFLTFPTVENLNKLPSWLKPTQSQISHGHPGFVDCLVWPHLREHLVSSWHKYDLEKLSLQLVRNFEVDHGSMTLDSPLLSLNPNTWELQLCRDLEDVLQDIRNFRTKADFGIIFPELMPCVRSTACRTCHLPLPSPAALGFASRRDGANRKLEQSGSEENVSLSNIERILTDMDYFDPYKSPAGDVARAPQQAINSDKGSQNSAVCDLTQTRHNDAIHSASSQKDADLANEILELAVDHPSNESWFYDQMDAIFGIDAPNGSGFVESHSDLTQQLDEMMGWPV